MKTIIFSITLLFATLFSLNINGQDLILLRGGEEITGKVTEIKEDKIFYKNTVEDTVIQNVAKSSVFMVKFENGVKIVFDEPVTAPVVKKPELIEIRGKGYYYYDGRYYNIKQLRPILTSMNDSTINKKLENARTANIGGTVAAFASIPIGVTTFVMFALYNDAVYSGYNNRDQEASYFLAGTGVGTILFMACHVGNIVLKKVVRGRNNDQAVRLYNKKVETLHGK